MNESKIKRAWTTPGGRTEDDSDPIDVTPYEPCWTEDGREYFFSPDGIWHWGEIKVDVIWTDPNGRVESRDWSDPYEQHRDGGAHYHTADGHLVLGTLEDEDWQVEKELGRAITDSDKSGYVWISTPPACGFPEMNILTQEADMDYTELIKDAVNDHMSIADWDVFSKYWDMNMATYFEVLRGAVIIDGMVVVAKKAEAWANRDKD